MTHILDIGVNPKGSGNSQLENWEEEKDEGNFKVEDTQVQSIMRYNQLFTVKTQITIPANFNIKVIWLSVVFQNFLRVIQTIQTLKVEGYIW